MAEVSKIGNYRKKGWLLGKSMAEPGWIVNVYLAISVYVSIYLSVCLSVRLSVCLSVCLSIYLSIYRSIDRSIYRSIDLSIYLSIYLSCYLSDHLSIQPVLRHFLSIYTVQARKTSILCETSCSFARWKLENKAFLRSFLHICSLKA